MGLPSNFSLLTVTPLAIAKKQSDNGVSAFPYTNFPHSHQAKESISISALFSASAFAVGAPRSVF